MLRLQKEYFRKVGLFMEWKKMSAIARELDVSKDVIKYHRKTLDPRFYKKNPSGEILISTEGIEYIQSKLRKERYDQDFEKYVKHKLRLIEANVERIDDFLVEKLLVEPSLKKNPPEISLINQLKNKLDQKFIDWYCEKEQLDHWENWRWEFIKLTDVFNYLESK